MNLTVVPYSEDSAWLLDDGVKIALVQRTLVNDKEKRREYNVRGVEIKAGGANWYDETISYARLTSSSPTRIGEGE